MILVLVFSIEEDLNQDGTANFKGYAVVTEQWISEKLWIETDSGLIPLDLV
ncbi:MAG: hypothetical protein ACETWQ_17370 [Phycisphaerae bacterium]